MMKFPLTVKPVPHAKASSGEPEWMVSDATGWPVCLCWKRESAERIVEAMNAVASQSAAETGIVGLVTTDGRTPDEADITLATGAAPRPGDPG